MHTHKFTKVIATIGPSSDSEETIKDLISNGVDIFRFNTKHNTTEWHIEKIKLVKKVAAEMHIPVGTLLDLQGPEIRLETHNGEDFFVEKDEIVAFVKSFNEIPHNYPENRAVQINIKELYETLKPGDKFTIDDGYIDFEVVEKSEKYFFAKCEENSVIKNKKSVNLIGLDIDLPSLTHTDKEKIEAAEKANVTFVALSFVRNHNDIEKLRHELDKHDVRAKIVAKIESELGVDNIDEILDVCDALMIARGDLGIEMPIEKITHIQKELIKKCRAVDKPVIVATQMLQSMIENKRPTRAEAADIANAVYDETDCLMLSGETATVKYPVKSAAMMKKIALYNENHKHQTQHEPKEIKQTHLLVRAAMAIINEKSDIKIQKIIVLTESGYTARVLSSFRPKIPIIAISESIKSVEELSASYGVFPVNMRIDEDDLLYPSRVIKKLENTGLVEKDETLLILHGHKYQLPESTNALALVKVEF